MKSKRFFMKALIQSLSIIFFYIIYNARKKKKRTVLKTPSVCLSFSMYICFSISKSFCQNIKHFPFSNPSTFNKPSSLSLLQNELRFSLIDVQWANRRDWPFFDDRNITVMGDGFQKCISYCILIPGAATDRSYRALIFCISYKWNGDATGIW